MAGTISLSSNEVSIHEGDGVALVTFKRTGDLSGAVNITYGINNDSATNGQDYTGVNGVAVMADGADQVTISIPIINDNLAEATEAFVVSLVLTENAAIGLPRTTRVSILDDENPVQDPIQPPMISNYNVTMQPVFTGLMMPLKMEFSPIAPNLVYVAEKGGLIKVFNTQTNQQVSTFLNLTNVVNDVQDRGLMDIAFHPDFANNHYFYAFYVVDPAGVAGKTGNAGPDGMGNRYAHVVRYTADAATNYTTALAGSGVVILGGAGQSLNDIAGAGAIDSTNPANVNLLSSEVYINPNGPAPVVIGGYKQDYIKLDSLSHAGGSLSFGPDGKLYVAIGDGTSFDFADPRTVSVQSVNSLSGKILRVDPITGDGLTDNPYYAAGMSLDANAAKVYQLGVRNPFSTGWTPDGRLIISDTGWFTYERIFTGNPGANFGWPWYEGADAGVLQQTAVYKDFPQAQLFYQQMANGQVSVIPAFRAFAHDSALPGYQVQAITAGDVVYTGDKYPALFQNDFFFVDQVDGEIFTVDVNNRQQLEFLVDMPNDGYGPTDFKQGPDGYVYYVDIMGVVGRILITEKAGGGGNAGFQANGTAVASGVANDYRLTNGLDQVGTVMSKTQIDVRQNFSIAFKMLFGQSDAGADGMGFILHNDPRGATTVGDGGWGLGFEYIQNGLAISFDTYTNPERNDLATDGTAFENSATLVKTAIVNLGNIENGLYHDVVVAWNAATSTLTYTVDGVLRGTLTDANLIANYFGGSPNVYFGFTASTGGAFNETHVTIGAISATYAGAVNHAPVAGDDAFIGTAGSILPISLNALLQNDNDPDGDSLMIGAFTNAQNGLVSTANGQVLFTPTAGFVGTASFDYTILDGKGGEDFATVTIDVRPAAPSAFALAGSATVGAAPGEFIITNALAQVGAVNSTARIDFTKSFAISYQHYFGAADSGEDGSGFIFQNDALGSATLGDGGWGLGLDYIDNGLGIAFDTYQNIERGELATDSTFFVNTATLARTALIDLGNIENNLYHQVVINWNAATSTLTYSIDGILRGTLTDANIAANYFGGSNFAHFGFTGSTGGAFNLQQVKAIDLDVVYEGRARPVANADGFETQANVPIAIQAALLLGNDTDADGDALTLVSVSNAVNATVSLTNGVVTLTPTAGFAGVASFNYKISDGFGAVATGVATVNVVGVAGTPVATIDGFTVAEDASLAVSAARNVLSNDSDPQGTALTAILVAGPSHGTLSLNANGTFSYTPTANYNGADSFTYRASDGALTSEITTVNLTVTPVNDTPVITYNAGASTLITIQENTNPILAQVLATDVDGGALTYTLAGTDAGDFTIGANGALRFAAMPNFEAPVDSGPNNVYNVTVQVRDAANALDTQAFTITVMDVAEGAIIVGTNRGTTVNGSSAAERFQPLAGNDTVNASSGNDIFLASLNDGNDTYNGSTGSDTVSYAAITTAVTASLASNSATGSQIGTDTFSSIDNLIGGSGGDTLTGNGAANILDGGLGNDTLTGSGGVDTFVFKPGTALDRITDFNLQDMIDVSAYNLGSYEALVAKMSQVGADTVIDLAPGDQITLTGFLLANLGASEFLL